LRPNLTLTAGIRYEYFQPEYETHNFFGSFSPALYNPSQAPVVNADGTLEPGTGNPLNGIVVAGNNDPFGRALFPSHKNAFAPRLGIVWDPTNKGKMSIRAGYGIFYDRWGSFSQFGGFNPPFNSSVNIFNTLLSNPGGATGALFPSGLSAALPPWDYPQVQKWSVSVQREVGFNTAVSVAYVGTKGTHLLGATNLNQPYPNADVANGNIAVDTVRPYPGYSTITAYRAASARLITPFRCPPSGACSTAWRSKPPTLSPRRSPTVPAPGIVRRTRATSGRRKDSLPSTCLRC